MKALSYIIDENQKKNENQTPYSWINNTLIAHAAGEIDGAIYTNSLEAFEVSYQKGHRLFEVDLSITSDSKLIARHGWDELYGQQFKSQERVPAYKEFIGSLYYGKYTPIDFKAVLKLLEKYTDIYLILDGKVSSEEDTKALYEKVEELLRKYNYSLKKRLIPQMFYEKDIKVLRNLGFRDIVYVVGREEYTPESIAKFCAKHEIRVVSLSVNRTNEEFLRKLIDYNILAYMYTINDVKKMKSYLKMGVTGFFTDTIVPNDLKTTN